MPRCAARCPRRGRSRARAIREALAEAIGDCCITDPPYNCGKRYDVHRDDMGAEDYRQWLASCLAALRTDNLVYTPGDAHFWDAPPILTDAGFPHLNRMLGWHKKEFAGDKWTGGPAICWEPIIWASRTAASGASGKLFNRVFGTAGRDFLVVDSTHGDPWAREHPCPKPLPVARWLVGLFCPVGGCVLDPFMGTGTVGAASMLAGRRFVGAEISPTYFDAACRRIETAARQKDLFIHSEEAASPDLFAQVAAQ